MNQPLSKSVTVSPVATSTTSIATSVSTMPTTTHTCLPHPTESYTADCQFVKVENEILKKQLDSCKSFPSTCASSPSTDTPPTIQNTSTHVVYVWFGFFIGFFVGCLFIIFINSATYKNIKKACCHCKKSVVEREREMNEITNKKDSRKETKKEKNQTSEKKEEKTQATQKTNANQTERKKKEEERSWEDKNKLKQELNEQKPPPRNKKISPLPSFNLIELNEKEEKVTKEEKAPSEEKISSEEKNAAVVDSIAIMIENV